MVIQEMCGRDVQIVNELRSLDLSPDPSNINLDAFLLQALEVAKDRSFILKTEFLINNFIRDKKQQELEFPPLNSYFRRLVHRIARIFGLEHRVVGIDKILVLSKGANFVSRPILQFIDWIPVGKFNHIATTTATTTARNDEFQVQVTKDQVLPEAFTNATEKTPMLLYPPKILKRLPKTKDEMQIAASNAIKAKIAVKDYSEDQTEHAIKLQKSSLAGREEEYKRARERIFQDFAPEHEQEEFYTLQADRQTLKLNPFAKPFLLSNTDDSEEAFSENIGLFESRIGIVSLDSYNMTDFESQKHRRFYSQVPSPHHILIVTAKNGPLSKESFRNKLSRSFKLRLPRSRCESNWGFLVFPSVEDSLSTLDTFRNPDYELKLWEAPFYDEE